MSTNFVTTTVGKGEGEISYVAVRNNLLNALTISSGAVDAVSFLALGKVFTAFMTGNFAFLGMAIASATGSTTYGVVPPRVMSVLAALAGFAVGVFLGTTKSGDRVNKQTKYDHKNNSGNGQHKPRQIKDRFRRRGLRRKDVREATGRRF